MMKRFLSFAWVTFLFFSCETGGLTSTPSEIEGVWIFKGYQQGTYSCEDDLEKVTLEITRKGDKFEISGQSFINTYFSRAEVSYNRGNRSGSIAFEGIGTTKMGGPEHLMSCESVYYKMLGDANTLKIEDRRLYLGRIPLLNESRLPDTLIFEKKGV
ncbi:MAG: META domain-containing protein [Leadbetterella sp.]|nr:META domain-containing protein [Leadbetterella sp.]